ncbi:MAG: ATP-binding protein [Acidimicrobiales bacterium]
MSDTLVEREDVLALMNASFDRARNGHGELVLLGGEAGAGKTSVIREFVRTVAGRPLVLLGSCDPLSAPRPFGPLIDAAHAIDSPAARRIGDGATRAEVFEIAFSLVDGSRLDGGATVLVIEDAHWADDATLDLITFIGRRIATLPTMFVISYRDDEVGVNHPLRARFGELGATIRTRIQLGMLSLDGVARLADGTGVDPDELHRMTLGNPFYVTEILGAETDTIPESIRDAVLARAGRLPPVARSVLDAAAIVPGRVEHWLLESTTEGADLALGLDICAQRGLLRVDESGSVRYRHELARLAVVEALTTVQRRTFHGRALAALADLGGEQVDVARLAYHAAESDDTVAVLQHAPRAAAAASAIGSHREAASHLEVAVRHSRALESRQRADLLVRLGNEMATLSRWEDAIESYDRAGELYAKIGDIESQAETLVKCDRPLWGLGRQPEALAKIEQADQLLRHSAEGRSVALVATSLCAAHMLARRFGPASLAGARAMAAAEQIGERDILAEASIVSGISLSVSGDDGGLDRVRKGIDIASATGNDSLVALGHMQIGTGYGELRRYEIAVPALREGMAFADAREIVWAGQYMSAWLARCHLEMGDWDAAAGVANRLLRNPRCVGNSRFVALLTVGWLRGRRGDPEAVELLDEALDLARDTGHVQRLWPIAACRAEIAWLTDRLDLELDLVREVYAQASQLKYEPAVEELGYWVSVADGTPRQSPRSAQTPFGASAAGEHSLAASWWAEIGCPYEEAMERFATSDAEQLLIAFRTFEELGAAPMRKRVAAAMRSLGAAVPRGPIASTRRNPYSLTDREIDVLALISTGRTNREIGGTLEISVKTVGHHVSHVLSKLGVRSRSEAAVEAERLGLTAPGRGTPA